MAGIMAYRFRKSETLGVGVRRIARELIAGSSAGSGAGSGKRKLSLEARIHESRKGMKKLRALIRLVSPASKSPLMLKTMDRALGRAAGHLSTRRDADVIYKTLCAIAVEKYRAEKAWILNRKQVQKIFSDLTGGKKADKRNVGGEAAFGDFSKTIQALRDDIGHWKFHQSGLRALDRGYIATYREARRRMLEIHQKPTDKRLHAWRKHVKYHFYHARLLEAVKAGCDKDRIEKCRALQEILGEHHDLHMLKCRTKALAKETRGTPLYKKLLKHMKRKRRALEDRAMALGAGLFADETGLRLVSPPSAAKRKRVKVRA